MRFTVLYFPKSAEEQKRFTLPRRGEMYERLSDAQKFSKMDLKTVLHQIRVRARDIYKTDCTIGELLFFRPRIICPDGIQVCTSPYELTEGLWMDLPTMRTHMISGTLLVPMGSCEALR